MKRRIEIETIDIPEIAERDVLDTIEKATQILRRTTVRKQETSIWKTLQQVIRLQGWRSLCIQALIILCMLYVAWIEADLEFEIVPYNLLIVSGAIMSVAACSELLRGDIYQMWELESACVISRQRLFIWKMILLDICSIFGIILISFLLANRYNLAVLPLLLGGCVPFLLMNAIALQFQIYTKTFTTFILLYGTILCIVLFSGIFLNLDSSFLYLQQNVGSVFLLIIICYTLSLIMYQYKKEEII